jgi:hypothetical protein
MPTFEKTVGDVPVFSTADYDYETDPSYLCARPLPNQELYHSIAYSKEARQFRTQFVKRSPDLKKLLPEQTAAALGIPFRYEDLRPKSLTLRAYLGGTGPYRGLSPLEIVIDPRFHENRFSFGHELGHYFAQEVMGRQFESIPDWDEEEFCDYFAITLVMSEGSLYDIDTIDEETIKRLVLEHDLSPRHVIKGLIQANRLPDNVHIDTYSNHDYVPKYASKVERVSVCLRCETTGGGVDCSNANLAKAALFDFTDRAWASQFHRCSGEIRLQDKELERTNLTDYYQSRMSQLALFPPMSRKGYGL